MSAAVGSPNRYNDEASMVEASLEGGNGVNIEVGDGQNGIPHSATALGVAQGTIMEAAFVDPAYPWPPGEGQGRNAIELQASIQLLESDDGDENSILTTDSMRERMKMPEKPVRDSNLARTTVVTKKSKKRWWNCCKSEEAVTVVEKEQPDSRYVEEMMEYREKATAAREARKAYNHMKKERLKKKEHKARKQSKYNRVPEGILIYRLDTTMQTIKLMSPPHEKTDRRTLIREMVVTDAKPSPDKSRKGMILTDENGNQVTLIACEQRTSIAWLESMNLMLAKREIMNQPLSRAGSTATDLQATPRRNEWSKERLQDRELDNIEDQYVNLAMYSNRLIRAGALPGGKKGSGGAGGIYYSVQKVNNDPFDDAYDDDDQDEEEALEAVAKRRAVIKDSWDFYRMICSLLRDRSKYDEVFRKMELDPVYPYLNSMTGLNDPGDTGYENTDKPVFQRDLPQYSSMSKTAVAQDLMDKAEAALPSLVEICKALAGSLGMEEVGVGPVKDLPAAMRKAEKKYDGDILKVTDFCRALLVVKDFPSLLALLELARDSFGPLIRRVKMCTLKSDHKPKPGGYRDCIINLELKEHICEIQVHLWPMWIVCGVDGFRHYRHCVEYSTDSFDDAYDALDGLDRKTMAELIVMAEEAVADTPLEDLEWYHEKFILDYFAEAGLFMKHGLDVWAEITFRHLIRLRTESPDIGPDHHETVVLHKYLAQCLRAQGKYEEATEVMEKVRSHEQSKKDEKTEAEKSLWDSIISAHNDAYDMIMDPNRKEREEEEKLRKEVKASKKQWRRIRQERFQFLDMDVDPNAEAAAASPQSGERTKRERNQQQREEAPAHAM